MHPRLIVPRLAGALVVALLAACGGGGDGPVDPQPTPAQLQRVDGATDQTATVGMAVPVAPSVRVVSNLGQPMAGVTVAFTVTAGGGTVGAASAQTNAQGIASVGSWTLGPTAGSNTLRATVGTLTADFAATATAAPPPPPNMLVAAQVDAGLMAQCARTAAGALQCWGNNTAGLVGDGTKTFQVFPTAVAITGVTFSQVSVGETNSCALTAAGAAYCWGTGAAIGDGTFGQERLAPTAVTGGHAFTSITVGQHVACALKADGSAWCWGATTANTQAAARTAPTAVSATLRFTHLATVRAGSGTSPDITCGITTTGPVYCWGISGIGDPAAVTVDASRAPAQLGGNVALTSLVGGRDHFCGLAADGRAYCWGSNATGQLGDNSTTTRTTPVLVQSGTTRFSTISAGGTHSCALTAAGAAWCWGASEAGQLGTGGGGQGGGPVQPTPQATQMPAGVQFASITTGLANSCAVAAGSGTVYCWGAVLHSATARLLELTPATVPLN